METFIQALIVSFREGLEAFLIIAVLLKFLEKTNNTNLKKSVWQGTYTGVIASLSLGIILTGVSFFLGGADATAKLWESVASFIAVILITFFILWMIKYGHKMKDHIENKATANLSKSGLFLLALFMVTREGAEIAIFSFAGKYSLLPIIFGLAISIALAMVIYHSIVNINIKTVFTITLAYLILQAGFLLGYSIHEGFSSAKSLGMMDENSPLFTKAFDVSKTVFSHKEGIIGVPLYVVLGWYSKPEWIQFIVQYAYTFLLFAFWYKERESGS